MNMAILTAKMEDGIYTADVGQESVSETLTFMSSFNQTSNIHDREMCRNFAGNKIILTCVKK